MSTIRSWYRETAENRREFKWQHDRGNRTESLWEGNLPLRGSLRGRVFMASEVFIEVFRRFSEIFQRFFRGPLRDPLRGRFPSQSPLHLAKIRSLPGKPNQRKASSWTFPGGIPEQKFDMWVSCLFSQEKTPEFTWKWAKFIWTFRFGPFFGLVCWGDSLAKNKGVRSYCVTNQPAAACPLRLSLGHAEKASKMSLGHTPTGSYSRKRHTSARPF